MKIRSFSILLMMLSLLLSACVYRIPDNTLGSSEPALQDTAGVFSPTEESIDSEPTAESESTLPSVTFDAGNTGCATTFDEKAVLGKDDIVEGPYTFRTFAVDIYGDYISGLVLFSCAAGVVDVVIPEEVNGIPVVSIRSDTYASVFQDAASVRSVEVPETVCYIGYAAFNDCSNLTELTLPAGIRYIGEHAFYNCPGLKKLQVGADTVLEFCALDNAIGLEQVIIEDGFDYNGICYLSFANCISLKEIYLPDSITSFVSFVNCASLENIRVSKGITKLEWFEMLRGSSVTFLELPEGVTMIGIYAFQNSSLETVVLPSTLETVDYGIFMNCPLKEVFFRGTEDQCIQYLKNQVAMTEATIYYLSEEEPTEEGNFWHYVDGKPVIW